MSLSQFEVFLASIDENRAPIQAEAGDDWPFIQDRLISAREKIADLEDWEELDEIAEDLVEQLLATKAGPLLRVLLEAGQKRLGSVEGWVRGVGNIDIGVDPKGLAELADGVAQRAQDAPFGYEEVPVFYATDRARSRAGAFSGRRGELSFGMVWVSIPRRHRLGQIESPKWSDLFRRNDPRHFVLLLREAAWDRERFVQELSRAAGREEQPRCLVFVHGYNVTFSDAARRLAQMAYDLTFPILPVLYSWPSEGRLHAYTVDEGNVELSALHLRNVLSLLKGEAGISEIDVVAHSMGNRALVGALAQSPEILRNVILAAPDIDAELFKRVAAQFVSRSHRVTLYASSRDRALVASRVVHRYARAGECGEEPAVVMEGVDTVDASAVDSSLLGHSYIEDNRSVLSDMYDLVTHGTPPPRFGMEARMVGSGRYWALRP